METSMQTPIIPMLHASMFEACIVERYGSNPLRYIEVLYSLLAGSYGVSRVPGAASTCQAVF